MLDIQEQILDNLHTVTDSDLVDVFHYYQQNPTVAALDLLGGDVADYGLPWHQRVMLKAAWDKMDVLQVWSRGAGKTWFLSMFAMLSAILYPNEKVGIFSASFRQAKFVFAEVEKLYEKSPFIRAFCNGRPKTPPDKCQLKFKNGSVIEALPLGDGQKIRGARYYRVIVDEGAQVPENILDIVIQGMRATTKSPMENVQRIKAQRKLVREGKMKEEDIKRMSNKILIASTAFYRFNHLWRRVCVYFDEISDPKNKRLHPEVLVPNKIAWNDERAIVMMDKDDPPEGFMDQKSIAEARRHLSDVKYRMEYWCYFPPDSEGVYKRSKLEKMRDHDKYTVELEGDKTANYVLGIDTARSSDNFAMVLGKIIDNKLLIVRTYSYNDKSYPFMHDKIRKVLQEYNVIRICMDTGGGGTALQDLLCDERMSGGRPLVWDSFHDEDLKDKPGLHILDMVKFSDDSIPPMAENLAANIDHQRILLPAIPSRCMPNEDEVILKPYEDSYLEIEEMIEETTSIIASATRTGRLHYGLPEEMGKEKKDEGMRASRKDRWTAFMLCNWAWHRAFYEERIEKSKEIAWGFALG